MDGLFYISAITLGAASSLHCVGMCGPLVINLPVQHTQNKLLSSATYLVSKALAYGLLGLVAGAVSGIFSLVALQRSFFMIMGLAIIFFSLWPAFKIKLAPFDALSRVMATQYGSAVQRPSLKIFSYLGFLNGFIPCGMLYAAMAASAAAPGIFGSFIFMLLFGLSSAPGLLALMLLKSRIGVQQRYYLKKISTVILVCTGAFLVWRSIIPVEQHSRHLGREVFWCLPG